MRTYLLQVYTNKATHKALYKAKNYDLAMEKAYKFAYKITEYGNKDILYMITATCVRKDDWQGIAYLED